jgi:hypothetical protein
MNIDSDKYVTCSEIFYDLGDMSEKISKKFIIDKQNKIDFYNLLIKTKKCDLIHDLSRERKIYNESLYTYETNILFGHVSVNFDYKMFDMLHGNYLRTYRRK